MVISATRFSFPFCFRWRCCSRRFALSLPITTPPAHPADALSIALSTVQ